MRTLHEISPEKDSWWSKFNISDINIRIGNLTTNFNLTSDSARLQSEAIRNYAAQMQNDASYYRAYNPQDYISLNHFNTFSNTAFNTFDFDTILNPYTPTATFTFNYDEIGARDIFEDVDE